MANRLIFINNTTDTAAFYDFDGNRVTDPNDNTIFPEDIALGAGDWQGAVASDSRIYFLNSSYEYSGCL